MDVLVALLDCFASVAKLDVDVLVLPYHAWAPNNPSFIRTDFTNSYQAFFLMLSRGHFIEQVATLRILYASLAGLLCGLVYGLISELLQIQILRKQVSVQWHPFPSKIYSTFWYMVVQLALKRFLACLIKFREAPFVFTAETHSIFGDSSAVRPG